ncbi:hypothetical protein PIB30_064195 [Stylosanthes scabra]|uniref:NB-ARC domain-containing protein n=1 Tax=Stylosanthes scabra TaxID=79078 RepID=A0ABU6UM97_9FABA|nr:hypothetical protein [Stylosanthes scabra]
MLIIAAREMRSSCIERNSCKWLMAENVEEKIFEKGVSLFLCAFHFNDQIQKNYLAQLVYSDAKVVENFDIRVWVCVAENSDPVHVTRTIIGAIDPSPCSMDMVDPVHVTKTFLVVLDDVWHGGRDTWENLLKPFQYGNNGSKILLTTRSEKVASMFVATSQHYPLGLLSDEDCWSVFLKHSSISTNLEQYAILEPIGRNIVEKCKGLPLAVKTLGSLLRNKCDVQDWEKILESGIWELREDERLFPH